MRSESPANLPPQHSQKLKEFAQQFTTKFDHSSTKKMKSEDKVQQNLMESEKKKLSLYEKQIEDEQRFLGKTYMQKKGKSNLRQLEKVD
mmetsp:Transcript_18734/g.32025  ORF Transcript_18734/g.32025 Transcript_18734/m.32025 type:complete len:89 (-) Transcript_18734:423-689(-)|eukprot:CAMPEP_0168608464 /NCGR_PEP_ID=MMETSP0449_2-20121227/642_1 /TAXON_ID=1082188 /ORGANISM="Strombidium rassoulzadegani, Strain ras09" /LENGTH=88 /DNA_ID=CAMNT_0008648453 /DNA_START=149 /DNA_END=415 /DNA_ORIENTATION=-